MISNDELKRTQKKVVTIYIYYIPTISGSGGKL
jgi:hypothetical protein